MLSLDERTAIHASKARGDTALVASIALSAEQIACLFVVNHLAGALIPHRSAVDAKLADDAAFFKVAVAEDDVVLLRRRDELH